MPYLNGRQYSGYRGINMLAGNGALRFETPSVTPTTTTGERLLYVNSSNQLIFDDGATTLNLSTTVAGAGTTLDGAYDNGATITVDVNTLTLTQTLDSTGFLVNKTGTGAGLPVRIVNAGTGEDFQVETTRASSTGVVLDFYHNSASPADADVIFEAQFNGEDDGGNTTEYGRLRVLSDDVTDTTEDATFQLALFVAGTSRTCLDITGSSVVIGDGNSNATLDTSGAFDLVLQTNAGTNSGTFTIFDGANGNIEVAPNGTGDLTIPAAGIVQGGSTGTRCSFTTGGTTGDSFLITNSTITSGDVLAIDHTVSATLNGGNLLNLLVDSTSVFAVGENGLTTIAGVGGSNAISVTAGDGVLSDGSWTITDADNALTLSVTNSTTTTGGMVRFTGAGVYTGTTTSAFLVVTPSGLTTGTGVYIACAAATTLSYAVDVTTSTTTGSALRLTTTGVETGVGSALEIVADSATTPGASAGEGVVKVSADGLTTGTALDVTSTSIVLTTGRIADFSHISGNITGTLDKTVDFFNVSSFRTVTTGTVADDYNMLNLVRTSVINGGGTFTATGAVLYIENAITNTSGTVTDTVNGIELVMDSLGTGDGFLITDNRTTGSRVINMTSAVTTGTGMLMTLADLTTSGVGLSITNSTSTGLTSGSLIRVTTATTGAVATNGVVSIRATGAYTSTSNVGLLDVLASGLTGAGTVVRIAASAAGQTASKLLHVEASGYTTGYTGDVMAVTGVSTTGASNLVLLTGANTSAGAMLRFTNNALTTGVGMIFAHTTSVIADGGSMLRLSSSSVDTGGATNGTVLDIASTGSTAGVAVLLTDSAMTTGAALSVVCTGVYTGTGNVKFASAATSGVGMLITNSSLTTGTGVSIVNSSSNTGAWKGLSVSVTNTAATAAAPIRTSNVAVNNSKFTKVLESTDGTKTVTIWMSQDATTPNGTLSGTAGDICLNGPSNRTFYCTGTTNWTASNA